MSCHTEWCAVPNMREKSTHIWEETWLNITTAQKVWSFFYFYWHRWSTLLEVSPAHCPKTHPCGLWWVYYMVFKSTNPNFFPLLGCDIFFSCLPLLGCKVDMFDLKVEAVNTHRDRPLVSSWPFYLFGAKNMLWPLSTQLSVVHESMQPEGSD